MCQVVWLYNVVEIVVMSGEVACCSGVCDSLVGMSVFSIMCSELLIMSAISRPLWSSVCFHVTCEYGVWYVGDVSYSVSGVVVWGRHVS